MARASRNATIPVENLENQLKRSLQPVKPDPQFIDHLHDRLTTPTITILDRRSSLAITLLLAAFSLLTGVALVWILRLQRAGGAA